MVSRKEKWKFLILRTLGNFFLLFSLFGMGATFGPAFYFEVIYRSNRLRNITFEVSPSFPTVSLAPEPVSFSLPTPTPPRKKSFFGELTGGNRVERISPVSVQFGLVIPKIGANAPVIANVEAGKEEEYLSALHEGVAHAKGTVFPGVPGNIYLFAHSTDNFWNVGRYNAIFYLIKELENGDEIDVFFKGVRHIYRVINKIVADPSETRYLTQLLPYEQLTLQTCWPPGTTLKRLLVIARPERDILRF